VPHAVKPAAFEYHRPTTVAEAAGLLAELGDDAKVLAGGQSLIPMLALRLTVFGHLVDIGRIAELQGIDVSDGGVRIGAVTTEAAVERSAEVAAAVPLLALATPYVGHFQIRNRGTVGGTLAHADPAAEYPAVALALDASVEATSPRGTRTIAAGDLFTGLWSTALAEDEVLTSVTFPTWDGTCRYGFRELARRHGDFAIAGAAVALQLDGDTVTRCGIGLIGLGSTPLRASAAEQAAVGSTVQDLDVVELGRLATADLDSVPADLHGSADYRTHVGAVMVTRALQEALA
jgi:carbon-monoxide dehydrogenase medium subunit